MMKIEVNEESECFGFDLKPENVEEAALLVRFGLNATKELRCVDTTAYRDGTFTTWIVIGKKKNDSGSVRK